MRQRIIASLSVLALWWGAGANDAAAQFGTLGQAPPRVRPTVSPAINLGAGGAYSYYGYIKPQADATRSILNLQQTLNQMNPDGSLQGQLDYQKQLQPQPQTDALGGLQTGHAATFFNYGHYYPPTPIGSSNTIYGVAQSGFGYGLGGFGPTIVGGGGFGFGNAVIPVFFGNTFNQNRR